MTKAGERLIQSAKQAQNIARGMPPDIREKAERLLDGLGAFHMATREHKIGALSQALLEAHEAGMKAAVELLNQPGALRANLLRGSIKAPDDLVWLHDTNGPVAAKVLEAHNAGRAEMREEAAGLCEKKASTHGWNYHLPSVGRWLATAIRSIK